MANDSIARLTGSKKYAALNTPSTNILAAELSCSVNLSSTTFSPSIPVVLPRVVQKPYIYTEESGIS